MCTQNKVQVWAKPQPHGAVAVLVINSNQVGTGNATVTLKALNLAGAVSVRDVWQHTDNGTITGQRVQNASICSSPDTHWRWGGQAAL